MSRLGHGKGYYDRFITSYTASRLRPLLGSHADLSLFHYFLTTILVALALRQQIIDGEVPMGEHDWKMDMIVGPDGIIQPHPDASADK